MAPIYSTPNGGHNITAWLENVRSDPYCVPENQLKVLFADPLVWLTKREVQPEQRQHCRAGQKRPCLGGGSIAYFT